MSRLPNFSFVCEGNKGKGDHRQLILLLNDSRYNPRTKKAFEEFTESELASESFDYYTRAAKSTSGSYSDRTYWLDETAHPLAREGTVTTPRAAFYCPKCRRATPPQSKEKLDAILKYQLGLSKSSFNIGLLFES